MELGGFFAGAGFVGCRMVKMSPVFPFLTPLKTRLRCRMATTTPTTRSSFSLPSIISIIAAIWSFFATALGGLVLAIIAIIFGLIGVLISLSPAKRGGVISTFGVGAGVIGIIAAVIKAIIWLVNRG